MDILELIYQKKYKIDDINSIFKYVFTHVDPTLLKYFISAILDTKEDWYDFDFKILNSLIKTIDDPRIKIDCYLLYAKYLDEDVWFSLILDFSSPSNLERLLLYRNVINHHLLMEKMLYKNLRMSAIFLTKRKKIKTD